MRRRLLVAALTMLAVAACGETDEAGLNSPPSAPGSAVVGDAAEPALLSSWRFVSLEVDGEPFPIDQPLFLDITADGFGAATTCNGVGGTFGGDLTMTAMACGDEAATAGEGYMAQAFATEPVEADGQMVFDDGNVRLVYEAFTDPAPGDLFAVLDDPSSSVDESVLPSEGVTGTVPPDFDTLVPLPSPSSEVDLFLSVLEGRVCVVYGTATALDKWCHEPRFAAERSIASNIPIYGTPLFRIALIPDRFTQGAEARPDLGTYSNNVLVVSDDAPEGNHTIIDETANTFVIVIPPAPAPPPSATTTAPEPPTPVTTAPTAAPQLTAAVFTTDHGCRWEFAAGDDEGTWQLHIGRPDQGPIPSGQVDLADSDVVATVTYGRDLFSNYCDDLILADEPTPVSLAEWPVIAGTFDMPAYDPDVANSLTITVRDAVVDTDAGPVQLEPIEFSNGCFGCFT